MTGFKTPLRIAGGVALASLLLALPAIAQDAAPAEEVVEAAASVAPVASLLKAAARPWLPRLAAPTTAAVAAKTLFARNAIFPLRL